MQRTDPGKVLAFGGPAHDKPMENGRVAFIDASLLSFREQPRLASSLYVFPFSVSPQGIRHQQRGSAKRYIARVCPIWQVACGTSSGVIGARLLNLKERR